jgi:hypothetical protein
MARFLIELPHEAAPTACARAVDILQMTKSHFLTQADWGCKDGEHKAWIILDVDSKNEARAVVPSVLRAQAKIVQLNTFSKEDIEEMARQGKH